MRLLSIGFPLPNQDVDNYNVFTAPSFFDYDALFVDPAGITSLARQLVEGTGGELHAFDDRPIVNGATTASAVSAADQLRRRLGETERLLEQGGAVIVIARPNATETGILGFEGCDRYYWLPAPEGLSWSAPVLQAAEGRNLNIIDDRHPLETLIREYRRFFGYRAVFDLRQPAVNRSARPWAEARPGLPVGVDFRILGGRVSFIPAVVNEGGLKKPELATAVVTAARMLLGERARETPPAWVSRWPVPGLEEAEEAAASHQEAMNKAAELLADARTRVEEAAIYRALLWAQGPEFEEAVRRALVLLGFEEGEDAEDGLAIADDGTPALVEVESSREQVAEWAYLRLQRRLDGRLRTGEKLLKGVIVANGFRQTDPSARKEELTGPLQVACQNYRYSLLRGETLLRLARLALEGASAEALARIRRRIIRGAGLITYEMLTGENEGDEEPGTLF